MNVMVSVGNISMKVIKWIDIPSLSRRFLPKNIE
jgi:hypothetical protein